MAKTRRPGVLLDIQQRFQDLSRDDFTAHFSAQQGGYNNAGEQWYLSGPTMKTTETWDQERAYHDFKSLVERAGAILGQRTLDKPFSWLDWLDLLRRHSPHFNAERIAHYTEDNERGDAGMIRSVAKASLEFWLDTLDALDQLALREERVQRREKAVEAAELKLKRPARAAKARGITARRTNRA